MSMRKAHRNASPEKAGLAAKHTATAASDSAALENAIFTLLAQRQRGASICPSDAARAVYPTADQWRAAMPWVRALAAQLANQGRLVVTQGGKIVDIDTAKGPIRLRLPPDDANL
jgi:Protein of unknown function (DUF3253)